VSGTGAITSSHLHAGPLGVIGPVEAAFTAPTAPGAVHCVAVADRLIREIRQGPGRYYVEVHITTGFQEEAALRGQLTR